jgi:choline kinase/phosphatidylglycerophosphate synthase
MNAQAKNPAVLTAVIVAAGKGTRLGSDRPVPKPLTPVAGVPLIARVMACAAKAGIRRFVVVTGFQAEILSRDLPRWVPGDCELEMIHNPRFEEPNGVSLLLAAQKLNRPFALLMSDHLFSPDRLRLAFAAFERSGRCLLVVEDRDRFTGDLEDATRVAVSGGKITAIGKDLPDYDAIDTGMFVLKPDLVADALNRAGTSPGISDGMRFLSREGSLDALPVDAGYWQDVDTAEDIGAAERKLYAALTKANDGFLARHVNRPVSLFLSTRLWRLGVTPNVVTAATLLLGLSAGWAFSRGSSVGWGLLGACLFQLQSVIDGVDGELARLLHKETRFGFWFDITVDNITHIAVFAGLALGQIADGHPGPWGILGIAAGLGVAASFGVMAPLLNAADRPSAWAENQGTLKRLVDGLSRRDFTYLLFPLAVFGWLGEFLWIAATGTWLFTAAVLFLRLKARSADRS